MSPDVLHQTYLPFTADQLRQHFAPVAGLGERDRHLQYYRASINKAKEYDELIRGGDTPTRAQTRLGRQMEKDERFWVVTALMSLYHADDGLGRGWPFALWVPNIVSPYATWEYSRIRPPSRSRRKTRTFGSIMGGCSRPAGGLWQSVRCGR